jgi:serine/threonine protein kinase
MGEVYRARDTRLQRDVAIKVLPAGLSSDPERLQRFEQEARAVAALSHPNILSLHDIGVDQGVSYAVTELLEGETLRSRLNRGALPWPKAVAAGVALAAFVKEAPRYLGKRAAVKVLRQGILEGGQARVRFEEEARLVGQLEHPSIVPVRDLGELPDGRPFFVMKLIHGQTLAALLAGGDDYELCFTAGRRQRDSILRLAGRLRTRLARIGRIVRAGRRDSRVTVLDGDGGPLVLRHRGFEHFS